MYSKRSPPTVLAGMELPYMSIPSRCGIAPSTGISRLRRYSSMPGSTCGVAIDRILYCRHLSSGSQSRLAQLEVYESRPHVGAERDQGSSHLRLPSFSRSLYLCNFPVAVYRVFSLLVLVTVVRAGGIGYDQQIADFTRLRRLVAFVHNPGFVARDDLAAGAGTDCPRAVRDEHVQDFGGADCV